MRRAVLTLSVAFACAVMANPVNAQVSFGVHGATITSIADAPELEGSFGLGARALLSPPIFPVALVGSATYYFPDCGAVDCSHLTYGLGVNLGLPLPVVRPYVHAGYQFWRDSVDGVSGTGNNFVAGLGVQLNFVVSVFLEGMFEFTEVPTGAPADIDLRPLVIKGGIIF